MSDESMPEFEDLESEEPQAGPPQSEWDGPDGPPAAQGKTEASADGSAGNGGNGHHPPPERRSPARGRPAQPGTAGHRWPKPPQAEFVEFQFPEAEAEPYEPSQGSGELFGELEDLTEEVEIPADILEDFLGAALSAEPGGSPPGSSNGSFSGEPDDLPTDRAGADARGRLATQAVRLALRRGSRAGEGLALRSAARLEARAPGAGWMEARVCSLEQWESAALMEALAAEAGGAQSETAASALAASLVPLVLRFEPAVARALWPVLPALILGVEGLARLFYRQPAAEALFRRLPLILRRTAAVLAASVQAGRPVGWKLAAATLARQAAAALGGPAPGRRGVTYTRKRR